MSGISKATKETKLNLSVCILTKNDQETVEDCFNSIKDIAREVVILDVGSTDRTVNIIKGLTNRAFWGKWVKDYAEARNIFFKYATSDWILYLDAFEILTPQSRKLFTQQLLDKKNVAHVCKVMQLHHDKEYHSFSIRLFRRLNDIRFKNVIYDNVNDDVQKVSRKQSLAIVPSEIIIERYLYKKYFDESDIHTEIVDLTSNALENSKKLDSSSTLLYKIYKGLALGSLGEYDDADEIMSEILDQIRENDLKIAYNIPSFIQVFLYFCYKYSKVKNYEAALKIVAEAVEIYHDSLTVLIRYAEQLYMNKDYKKCLEIISKTKELISSDNYYFLEPINFDLIEKLIIKLGRQAKEKVESEKTE